MEKLKEFFRKDYNWKTLWIIAIVLIIVLNCLGYCYQEYKIIQEYYVFSIIGFIVFAFLIGLCGFGAVIVIIFQKEPFKGQGYWRIYKTLFMLTSTYLLAMMVLASFCYFAQFETSFIDCMLSFYSLTEDSSKIKLIGLTEIITGFIFNTVFVGLILTFFQQEMDTVEGEPKENLNTYVHIENGNYILKYKLIGFGETIQKKDGIQYMMIGKEERIFAYELVKCEKKKSV